MSRHRAVEFPHRGFLYELSLIIIYITAEPEIRSIMEQPSRHYFPNLDGLRCIGVFIVLIAHLELMKAFFGYESSFKFIQYPDLGNVAVTWFMVVSGFLITILLLKEKSATNNISISAFYKRRIKRIWPIYYLVILVTFFVLLRIPFFKVEGHTPETAGEVAPLFGLYASHLSNLHFLFPSVVYVAHLWTVGVEEQFYLVWPWMMKFCRNIMKTIIFVIVIQMMIKVAVYIIPAEGDYSQYIHAARRFLFLSRFEAIALGGIAAWLYVNGKERVMNALYSKPTQVICLVVIGILLSLGRLPKSWGHFAHALFFAIIVLNLANHATSVIKLNWKPMQYIGRISYGMYVYHPIIMVIMLKLLNQKNSGSELSSGQNAALYAGVFVSTILISAISYIFLEKPIVNWKRK